MSIDVEPYNNSFNKKEISNFIKILKQDYKKNKKLIKVLDHNMVLLRTDESDNLNKFIDRINYIKSEYKKESFDFDLIYTEKRYLEQGSIQQLFLYLNDMKHLKNTWKESKMSKELYTKSKALGYDYVGERYCRSIDKIELIRTTENEYAGMKIESFDDLMLIYNKSIEEVKEHIAQYLNDDHKIIMEFFGDYNEIPIVCVYKHETEDDYIERKTKEVESKQLRDDIAFLREYILSRVNSTGIDTLRKLEKHLKEEEEQEWQSLVDSFNK